MTNSGSHPYRKGGKYYNPNITCIKVSIETRTQLQLLGHKGETYDEIIIKLIKKGKVK